MRPILILTILAVSSAACATPSRTPRPVVVHRAPTVVVEAPAVVSTAPVSTSAPAMAGGASTTPSTAFEKNPVPGSAREYINRYSSSDTMAK